MNLRLDLIKQDSGRKNFFVVHLNMRNVLQIHVFEDLCRCHA